MFSLPTIGPKKTHFFLFMLFWTWGVSQNFYLFFISHSSNKKKENFPFAQIFFSICFIPSITNNRRKQARVRERKHTYLKKGGGEGVEKRKNFPCMSFLTHTYECIGDMCVCVYVAHVWVWENVHMCVNPLQSTYRHASEREREKHETREISHLNVDGNARKKNFSIRFLI